jgi:hypothetical protein
MSTFSGVLAESRDEPRTYEELNRSIGLLMEVRAWNESALRDLLDDGNHIEEAFDDGEDTDSEEEVRVLSELIDMGIDPVNTAFHLNDIPQAYEGSRAEVGSPQNSFGAIAGSLNMASNISYSSPVPEVVYPQSHVREDWWTYMCARIRVDGEVFLSECRLILDWVQPRFMRTIYSLPFFFVTIGSLVSWWGVCALGYAYAVVPLSVAVFSYGGYILRECLVYRIRLLTLLYSFTVSTRRFLGWVASATSRVKETLRKWWDSEWNTKVIVCGYPVPRISFFAVALFISLGLCIVVYAVVSLRCKRYHRRGPLVARQA